MHNPRIRRFIRFGLAAILGSTAAACGGDDSSALPSNGALGSSNTTGSAGSGTSTDTSGNLTGGSSTGSGGVGTGGAGGGAGAPSGQGSVAPTPDAAAPEMCRLSTPAGAMIVDFKPLMNAPTDAYSWGDFGTGFSGYTYKFPDALVSDVTTGAWHISGSVADYTGFVLAFLCGTDASAYSGIQFTIKGSVGAPGALTLFVATAADEAIDPSQPTGRAGCKPVSNQYDGTCVQPSKIIAVTSDTKTIALKWSDFSGSKPGPVKPSEILALRWIFTWPVGAGDAASTVASYPVDVTIDDVSFVGTAADAAAD